MIRAFLIKTGIFIDTKLTWKFWAAAQFRFGAHDFHAIEPEDGDIQSEYEEVGGLCLWKLTIGFIGG